MSAIVIDTNVLLVADGCHEEMLGACIVECLNRLESAKKNEAIVVDRQFFILGEYQKKLKTYRRSSGPWYEFVKHILQNMKSNADRVSLVTLTPRNAAKTDFNEFPADENLRAAFDPADRKFVAAANAHPEKPPIVESADSKWLGWEADLKQNGIRLEILCRDKLEEFRRRKTCVAE